MAIIADDTEKIIAPLPKPDPCFRANNQNVFAMTYEAIATNHNQGTCLNDHSFAKTSAISSKTTSSDSGTIQFIR